MQPTLTSKAGFPEWGLRILKKSQAAIEKTLSELQTSDKLNYTQQLCVKHTNKIINPYAPDDYIATPSNSVKYRSKCDYRLAWNRHKLINAKPD